MCGIVTIYAYEQGVNAVDCAELGLIRDARRWAYTAYQWMAAN